MAKIQIFTVIGKNGIIFANFLHNNMTSLSSGQHELEFNCFMSSRTKPPTRWNALEYILKQKHTSLNHTTGLNRIFDYLTGDYLIVTDVDVAFLKPNWDTFFIETMEQNNIDIYGIDHWNNPRGYQNFPVVTFFIAKTISYLKANPDLRPNLHEYPNKHGLGAKEICITTHKESYLYSLPKKRTILQDSGWQLPISFKKAHLRGEVLPKAQEYPIDYIPQVWKMGEELGICHKGKSSKRRQSHVFKFIKSVILYVKETHGITIERD